MLTGKAMTSVWVIYGISQLVCLIRSRALATMLRISARLQARQLFGGRYFSALRIPGTHTARDCAEKYGMAPARLQSVWRPRSFTFEADKRFLGDPQLKLPIPLRSGVDIRDFFVAEYLNVDLTCYFTVWT
jgi:hypothetical protein